jgi:hypothetical protein
VTASTHEPDSEASVCRKCTIGGILWLPVLISRHAVQRQHSLTCLILPHISEKRTAFLDTIGKRWASEGLTRSAEPRRAKVRDGVKVDSQAAKSRRREAKASRSSRTFAF